MKKILILLMLSLSVVCFSEEKYIYEVVPMGRDGDEVKVVRVLEGEYTGLYGVINSQGEFIVKPNNFVISVQKNHIYLVDIDYNEGLMKLNGDWIAQMGRFKFKETYSTMYKKDYEEVERKFFIVYSKEGKEYRYGFINCEGDLQIPMIYKEVINFSEGLAGVKKESKWGFIDESGQVKIDFIFDEVNPFENGLALVRVEDNYFYIDENGEKKLFKSLYRQVKSGIENLGHHIGESFEGKLKIKEKTN